MQERFGFLYYIVGTGLAPVRILYQIQLVLPPHRRATYATAADSTLPYGDIQTAMLAELSLPCVKGAVVIYDD